MSELILKFNQLDEFGKRILFVFLDGLLRKTESAEKPKNGFDYTRFQIPVAQLKFDRDEMNSRD